MRARGQSILYSIINESTSLILFELINAVSVERKFDINRLHSRS